jgi:hypothetical protein
MPSTPLKGSLEIVTNPADPTTATSDGMVVEAMTTDLVPTLIRAVYGLTGIQSAEPAEGQVAAWTATNARLQGVRVNFWPETLPQGRDVPEGALDEQP